jgi:hypothetical protein
MNAFTLFAMAAVGGAELVQVYARCLDWHFRLADLMRCRARPMALLPPTSPHGLVAD